MKDLICVSMLIIVLVSNLIGLYNEMNNKIHNYNGELNNYNKNLMNISVTRAQLNKIVEEKKITIEYNIIKNITNSVFNEAEFGHTSYEWNDENHKLDTRMYENIINKLIIIFPDVRFEEYNGYTIRLDWS